MLHEILLHGSVPAHRHKQVLDILAGIAAHPPHQVIRRRYVFSPVRKPLPKQINQGGTQGIVDEAKTARQAQATGDVFLLQVVCEARDGPQRTWSIEFHDLPDAGNRAPGMTSRSHSLVEIEDGNAFQYLEGLGYQHAFNYITEGSEFISENLIMYLHRIMRGTLDQPLDVSKAIPVADLAPIDTNNGYILEIKVCLDDGSDPDLMAQAVSELQGIKSRFRGCVDLRQVDRLALDTRVR